MALISHHHHVQKLCWESRKRPKKWDQHLTRKSVTGLLWVLEASWPQLRSMRTGWRENSRIAKLQKHSHSHGGGRANKHQIHQAHRATETSRCFLETQWGTPRPCCHPTHQSKDVEGPLSSQLSISKANMTTFYF